MKCLAEQRALVLALRFNDYNPICFPSSGSCSASRFIPLFGRHEGDERRLWSPFFRSLLWGRSAGRSLFWSRSTASALSLRGQSGDVQLDGKLFHGKSHRLDWKHVRLAWLALGGNRDRNLNNRLRFRRESDLFRGKDHRFAL